MTTDKETIKKHYALLPEEIKIVYSDPQILDRIYDICVSYGVNHLDHIGSIDDAVYDIMLGLIKPTDFVSVIIKETGIGEDIANLIVHDINEQILKPIHDKLIEHQRILEGKSVLPSNVEMENSDLGFSSSPYQETNPINREQREMINEIEHPAPATYITRDNFTEKTSGLHSSRREVEKINLSIQTKNTKEKVSSLTETKPKSDPYREPI
jgi:hypothetical protein